MNANGAALVSNSCMRRTSRHNIRLQRIEFAMSPNNALQPGRKCRCLRRRVECLNIGRQRTAAGAAADVAR
jgi:hypothetical protein